MLFDTNNVVTVVCTGVVVLYLAGEIDRSFRLLDFPSIFEFLVFASANFEIFLWKRILKLLQVRYSSACNHLARCRSLSRNAGSL
jgi:hypothetical protein